MKLTLTYKSVFGRDSYYPDDDTSKTIASLVPCKSFAPWQIKLMKESAWDIEIKADIPQ